MTRKKSSDNPVTSQETPAKETTDIHINEPSLIQTASSDRETSDPKAVTFNDDARQAIFAKRKEFLEKELGIAETGVISAEPINDIAAEVSSQTGFNPPSDAEVVIPTAATAESEENPIEANVSVPSAKFKFNADGQQFECTPEELIQMAQRGVGAGRKFQEAADKERRAEALALMFQQNSQPQAPNNQQVQQQPLEIDENRLKDIAKRLNYGSEEEQVKALKEAGTLFANNAGKTAQQLNPSEIVEVATRNALNVMTANQEQEILKNEFKDIIADPALAQATDFIANQLANKYAALGVQKNRLDLLREAGNEAKQRYLRPVEASQSQTNSSAQHSITVAEMGNKVERKRAAPQSPTSANKVASSETQSYGVPAAQALDAARTKAFQEIARRRGQSA